MEINYFCKPQCICIEANGGPKRNAAVKLMLTEFMKLNIGLQHIAYMDDVLAAILPFGKQGSFLFCPSNAQKDVKEFVLNKKGFVSSKRSTQAVVEFLTDVYPKKHKAKHKNIHSIFFDMDGCLWEEERFEINQPFFKIITDYIRNCKGPYTAYPPISIATGANRKSLTKVLSHIGLNKYNIPTEFHRDKPPFAWPPAVFEEGCLALDTIWETVFDLTKTKYRLVSPNYWYLNKLIVELGRKIDAIVPEINKDLEANCKLVTKERSGYTLDIPLGVRDSLDDLRKAHRIIYKYAKVLLDQYIPKNVKIKISGLFSKNEIEKE